MRRESDAETMVQIFSRFPWWACLVLAATSYLALDHFAIDPRLPPDSTGFESGTMGSFTVKYMYGYLAWFGKFFFTFIFGLAAINSLVKSIDEESYVKRISTAIIGVITLTILMIALIQNNQPTKSAQQNITKRQEIEKQKVSKIINSNLPNANSSKEPAVTIKQSSKRQAIYSWTNKEGSRVHSNTGFPKNGEYEDPRIDYH